MQVTDTQQCDQAAEVTQVECEEALIQLQLSSTTVVRLCEDGSQLADLIVTFTKALAEAPYKYVCTCIYVWVWSVYIWGGGGEWLCLHAGNHGCS